MSSDISKLIIAPYGNLNQLSFEVFIDNSAIPNSIDYLSLPYLMNRYQFQYTYSAATWKKNYQRYHEMQTNAQCLALAPIYDNQDVSHNNTNRGNEDNLIGTKREVKAISNFYGGTFEINRKANEPYFIKKAPEYGLLHLAMHGEADYKNPEFANLKFSGDGENSDNLLYNYEIGNMKLKAQMAVLSACETGVGKEVLGEGVKSLARGFMRAGVPSVVMSLWKMNDQTTADIVPLFYKNLKKGLSKSEALHQAKLEYLDNAAPEYSHPFYWSGMVLLGEDGEIKESQSKSKYLFFILGGFLLIGFFSIKLKKRFTNYKNAVLIFKRN